MRIPEDLKYTREHEWLLMEEGTVTYGITDFAQSELGDIVFVELPEVGDAVTVNDTSGTIEAVKTVADIFSPVSGHVIEVNERLVDDPDLVNRDPYGEGWMIKVEVEDPPELVDLLSADEYNGLIEQEQANS